MDSIAFSGRPQISILITILVETLNRSILYKKLKNHLASAAGAGGQAYYLKHRFSWKGNGTTARFRAPSELAPMSALTIGTSI